MSALRKARFVERTAPQAEWRLVHRVADTTVPTAERAIRSALVTPTVRASKIEEHLANNDVEAAVNDVDLEPLARAIAQRVWPVLYRAYVRAAEAVVRSAGQRDILRKSIVVKEARPRPRAKKPAPLDFSFNETNPYAQAWAAEQSSRLVTQVTDETREAIRTVIGQSFSEGVPPRQLVRRIRPLIGLNAQYAKKIQRLRDELSSAGLAQRVIDRRIEFEATKAIRQRALNIARTETMMSSNAGQLEAWRQGRSAGLIAPELVKEWLITPDSRLCPICAPLEGEQRNVDEAFSWGGMNPPRHPQCRCAIGLVEPGEDVGTVSGERSLDLSFSEVEEHSALPGQPMPSWFKNTRTALNGSARDLRKRFPSLESVRGTGLILENVDQLGGGAIGSYMGTSKRIRLATGINRKLRGKLNYGSFNVDPSVVGTFRHEFGHLVHYERIGLSGATNEPLTDAAREWRAIWSNRVESSAFGGKEGIRRTISEYATTNERELFAESFSAYTHSKYKYVRGREGLPPDIQEFMEKHVGKAGGGA